MIPTGLYLHIPFCAVKCRFCDFAAYPGRRGEMPRYLEALRREIGWRAEEFPGRALESLFVGGGTPTLLDPAHWAPLFATVRDCFPALPGFEATVECTPETVSADLLAALRDAGVSRLSLGLQTHEAALLKALGRGHDWEGFARAFDRARRTGFDNLNVDLMYGLPGQTLAGWRESLCRIAALRPAHVSAYALSVEDGTYFHRSGVVPDGDVQADMYEAAADDLSAAGYAHYEISNFALPNRECRHNLRTWRNQESLGAGVSSAWYDGRCRRSNTENLTDYLEALEAGRRPPAEAVALSPEEREGETLMLGLRLIEGVAPSPWAASLYGEALGRGLAEGLLEKRGGRYRPTRKGWRLSNRLFLHFLSPASISP